MYHQSTAPLPRRARRGPAALLAALAIVTIGSGIGTAAYALATSRAEPSPSELVVASPTQVTVSTPTRPPETPSRATQVPLGAIGSQGQMSTGVAWVERVGLLAYQRAHNDRDGRGEMRSLELWEHFIIDARTTVLIVERVGTAAHIEFLDGPYAGRRGWLPADWITA